jgi:hypothetical protein
MGQSAVVIWALYSLHPIPQVEVVRQARHVLKEHGARPTTAQMKEMTNIMRFHLSQTVSREFYQSALSPSVSRRR